MEQKISFLEKQKWVTRLFSYDYEIIYKKGKEKLVVDALSRKYEEEWSLFYLSFIVLDWLQSSHREWLEDPKISRLIQQLQEHYSASPWYYWHNNELLYKGHLYLIKQSQIKPMMLSNLHVSPIARHLRFTKHMKGSNVHFLGMV